MSCVRGFTHLRWAAIAIILAGLIVAAAILILSPRLLEHWLVAFLAFLAAAAAAGIIIDRVRLYHGDDQNAQAQHPLLSTIVGTLAAILGLLFAATLVATQLAVEKFTGRVIAYRIRDPWLWATLAIFVAAMAVALLGIAWSGARRKHVDFALLLTGVALAYLVPFIVATLRSMETESFINFLLQKRDYVALEDLTRKAINDGLVRDVEAAMQGLREHTLRTLDSAKGDQNKAREFTQLGLRVGMYGAAKRDPETIIVAMRYLTGMTTACTSRMYRGAADLFNESVVQLHRIGEEAFAQPTKANSTLAELSQRAADSFLDIAQVKAQDRELNLRRAIDAYQEALGYLGPETNRLRTAEIQNNLGTAYRILAGVRDREPNLKLAIAAFREALRVRTFDAFPQDYATTESNLGAAYGVLADVRDKEPNLGLAIAAFREALRVRTFDAFPQDYAKTQNNLGNAYVLLAGVRDKEPNLNLAIAAFREALRVRTFDTFPQDYAMTQNNWFCPDSCRKVKGVCS